MKETTVWETFGIRLCLEKLYADAELTSSSQLKKKIVLCSSKDRICP